MKNGDAASTEQRFWSAVAAQVILTGEGRNFCGGIDLSVARGILKGITDAKCPSRAREQLRRDILAMQVQVDESCGVCVPSLDRCSACLCPVE